MLNISRYEDGKTANTNPESAVQRAEYLSLLGIKTVIELCVGPSLKCLERAYNKFGITVSGNDIDARWRDYYPDGRWIIGDALRTDISSFDAVVFAPPLSRGCSGKREDSLMIEQVFPRYEDFLKHQRKIKMAVLVLPGRTFATKFDRAQYHKLTHIINSHGFKHEPVPLVSGRRGTVKYIDLILTRDSQ